MAVIKNRALRASVFFLGILSIAMGIIGAFLPLLPTTPFVLLAAWCFLRSSEKAHTWIYRHPIFGPALQNWEQNKSIARSTKAIAISMIVVSVALIWIKVANMAIKCSVTVLLASVSIFILTRKNAD